MSLIAIHIHNVHHCLCTRARTGDLWRTINWNHIHVMFVEIAANICMLKVFTRQLACNNTLRVIAQRNLAISSGVLLNSFDRNQICWITFLRQWLLSVLQMVQVETIVTGVVDRWKFLASTWKRRMATVTALCYVMFFIALPMCTQVDTWTPPPSIPFDTTPWTVRALCSELCMLFLGSYTSC